MAPSSTKLPRNILLIQLRQLGDILLTTPICREIKRENPRAHVTFLAHPMGRLILDDNPFVDECFYYNPSSLWQEATLAKSLGHRKFDATIDYMNNPRSGLYTWASRSAQRVSWNSSRRFFYSDVVDKPPRPEYIVHEKFHLLRKLGYSPKDEQLVIPWHEPDLQPLTEFWDLHPNLRQSPLTVVLSATHRHEVRRWPEKFYSELAHRLVKQWQAAVIWLWGPGEKEVAERCRDLCPVATLLAPATTFRQMAAFLANSDLFIGNSNGPSHVAVAAGIPSFQIHGPTRLASWCPMNERHSGVEVEVRDGKRAAIDSISLDQVWEELESRRDFYLAFGARQRDLGIRLRWSSENR